ncbi:MAG: alginate lyase family protein [Bacteroides sp.]|nr:alginate lyase family protein [Bacteroides sp.]
MRKNLFLLLTLLVSWPVAMQAQSVWDAGHLAQVKQSIEQPAYAVAYQALIREADGMLDAEPLSVMMKPAAPLSGDKHDYMSLARYFWPDPTKPDGLPYISRDGLSNPELEKYDRNPLGITAHRVTTLALAWYFSGDEKYARKAAQLLRVWFLDKETCMNPNLNYAQVSRGHHGDKGRSYGVIDAYSFVEMLDGVQLLENSVSFTKRDSKRLKAWFAKFLNWLQASPLALEESEAQNNHSVAYDTQVIAYALYTGNLKTAREVINAFPAKRTFKQVAPDGSQPHELGRTLALHYSQYNLTHFIDIFRMARKLDLHIDRAADEEGRSFYRAMDFLAPYVGKSRSEWPYQQISGWERTQQLLCKDFYRAWLLNPERKEYLRIYREHRVAMPEDRFNLLYWQPTMVDQAYAFAAEQLQFAVKCATDARKDAKNAAGRMVTPRTIAKDGSLLMVHPHDWCSGFFAGSLWQLYDYTHDDAWREQAISWTWPIEEAKWHGGTHDLGFMMYDSFGKAYELTGERSYKDVVVQSARTLITRYNPQVKCIRSWDHNREQWDYPVIIDNLMNLEMLFRATQLTGDSVFWKVAVNHANTTMKNHFRPDYSSYHVIDYNPETGAVRKRNTHQGHSDDSFWSRGQGWGLYGYTMCYYFTRDENFLSQAEHIADFFINLPNMPADGVPYWDMKMESVNRCTPEKVNPDVPRDASAAALIASGLYELSTYVTPEKAVRYREHADKILESLTTAYQAPLHTHYGFLLLHSTGHHPGNNEIDVPLNYADYYYLEALARKEALDLGLPIRRAE